MIKLSDIKLDDVDKALHKEINEELLKADQNGDGALSPAELSGVFVSLVTAKRHARDKTIDLAEIELHNTTAGHRRINAALRAADADGSGSLSSKEIHDVLGKLVDSKSQVRNLWRTNFVLLLSIALALASIFGASFAAVEASKETKVSMDPSSRGALACAATGTPVATRSLEYEASIFNATAMPIEQVLEYYIIPSTLEPKAYHICPMQLAQIKHLTVWVEKDGDWKQAAYKVS